MDHKDFNRLDLNLLRVLDAVYRLGSIQAAAEQLTLTPSALSHALARLRQAVGDPLFVRQGGALRPTPYASVIAPEVREVLHRLEVAVSTQAFDPANTKRHFTIIGSSYMSIVLLPQVVARVRQVAPHAQISLRSSEAAIVEALDSGKCDIALGRFGRMPDRFAAADLFEERMVWVVRVGHSLLDGKVSIDRLRATPKLVISVRGDSDETGPLVVEKGLERQLRRDDQALLRSSDGSYSEDSAIAVTVPDAPTALHYVGTTNLAALLPYRLARQFADIFGLTMIDPPYPSPPNMNTMIWHRRLGDYPDAAWLRSIVRDAARQIGEEPMTAKS